MLFEELPRSLDKCKFVSKGATGWVFEAAPGIAIKYFVRGRLDEFQVENETYDLIERNHPPPLFIRSFLRLPGIDFMQLMVDSLDARLQRNQRRDEQKHVCLEVLRLEPTPKIEQWAAELLEPSLGWNVSDWSRAICALQIFFSTAMTTLSWPTLTAAVRLALRIGA